MIVKMKFVVLLILFFVSYAQANKDWLKIKAKKLHCLFRRPSFPLPKIVGGEEAHPHQFSYQVGLIIDDDIFCGGSLIREDVVLTAAHCVDSQKVVEVIAGAHYIQEEEHSQQSIISRNIIIHEKWDFATTLNDIALVVLPKKFILNDAIQLITVRQQSCPDYLLDNVKCSISGWGDPVSTLDEFSSVLRFSTEQIMSNTECNSSFGIIKESHICFDGSNGSGGCFGDSGGPMIVDTYNGVEQVGVASFVGPYGCGTGYPTVYTRVSCFYDWIQSKIY